MSLKIVRKARYIFWQHYISTLFFLKGDRERFSISNCLYVQFKIHIKKITYYLKILFYFSQSPKSCFWLYCPPYSINLALNDFWSFQICYTNNLILPSSRSLINIWKTRHTDNRLGNNSSERATPILGIQ